MPKALNDSNATSASETQLTLTGNVLTNDVQGADVVATGPNSGPITAGTFTGTYGTLVLNANGTYTYTLNPAVPISKRCTAVETAPRHSPTRSPMPTAIPAPPIWC